MTKKKLTYYEKRAIREEEEVQRSADYVENQVRNAYSKTQSYLTGEVKKIYKRYLNKTDKTEAEVKKILNTSVEPAELVKLKQLTKSIDNPQLKTESQNYLDGLAVKHRIRRLEDLKAKSYLVSKQVANVQLDKQTDFYIDTIHKAYNNAAVESIIGHADSGVRAVNDGKYKSWAVQDGKLVHELIDSESGKVLDTIKVAKDEPVTEFKELSTKYVRNILDSNWEGSNYSKRIWNDTELLAERLEELFTVEAMTGMSEQEMAKAIAKEFETSMYVARRLIRTEANYMAGQAKLKGWKEHGVKEYVIVAILDFKTSVTCQDQDGKRYKVEDAEVGVNYNPFHPFCRSVARAIFSEMSLSGDRKAIDRVTGEAFTIKQSTTYKEWEKMLLDKHGEKDLNIAKNKVKNYRSDLAKYNKLTDDYKKERDIKNFNDYQEQKYKDYKLKSKKVNKTQEPISKFEEAFGNNNYNKFKKSLENLPNSEFKELLSKHLDKVEFVKTDDKNVVRGQEVNLNQKTFDGTDSKKSMQSVYHELGHALDNLGSEVLDSDYYRASSMPKYQLKKSIQKDLLNTFNRDLREINGESYVNAKSIKKLSIYDESAIVRKYKTLAGENPQTYSSLSDMMESTGKFVEYPLGHGHGLKYWKVSGNQEAEFFAHMSESLVNDEARKMMYDTFPTASKKWEEIISDILKGG